MNVLLQNLDKQLGERFSAADSKLWRTSREVNYAEDVIELDIPHEILQEVGYEVHTDLGCVVSCVDIATSECGNRRYNESERERERES